MERIHEPARELDVIADADVVVIGGGPGGIPAADSAVWRPPVSWDRFSAIRRWKGGTRPEKSTM